MQNELSGRVEFIGKIKEFDSGFRLRDLVVQIGDQFPQFITVQFIREDCEKLDELKVGMEVTVGYYLNGRKWDSPDGTRYFNTLRASKLEITDDKGLSEPKDSDSHGTTAPQPEGKLTENNPAPVKDVEDTSGPLPEEEDDLPF